ncbi:MAG TPA: Gfo/Idh/MocA family oxidoreductase [Lacipirellulaceae bacterium]|nr:Gfo/Idh/MocA family oxidoreductase [Lacipirellulaceae bacterium]
MSLVTDRRKFLQTTAVAGLGYWVAGGLEAAISSSPNEQIQVGCIGVGGKGQSDVQNMSKYGKIYALCDVDSKILDGMVKAYKTEHNFTDFREMLDKMGDRIDAVTVSVPDHNHAVMAAKAMKMGKHVHCQKPLAHSIWEARRMGEIAREKGVATQMGNQFTAYNPMRKAAYQVRAGNLGTVKEVHIWTNRPIWPQGGHRPMIQPVPANLDWEVWIGPAPWRPYGGAGVYHQFAWRGWWDFGTGALGDMACHTCNLPFMALNMRDPISVEAACPEHDGDTYPTNSKIKYEFPELNGRAPFTMHWYDGGNLPPAHLFQGVTLAVKENNKEIPPPYQSGALIIGDKAKMYAAGDYAEQGIQIVGAKEMDVDYPRSPGHEKEWFIAMRNSKKPAMSNFPDYAGPLTETILLGNLAVYKRGRVEWDPVQLKPLNDPWLMHIVHPTFRSGYEV